MSIDTTLIFLLQGGATFGCTVIVYFSKIKESARVSVYNMSSLSKSEFNIFPFCGHLSACVLISRVITVYCMWV